MQYKNTCYSVLKSPGNLEIHHLGPPLQEGPLPTLLYFALSGEESLNLDPYNQPALFFSEHRARVISFTLPFHGRGFDNKEAMALWAHDIRNGHPILNQFFVDCRNALDFLLESGVCDPHHLAVAGLSRGGFIATHLAARDPRLGIILGYAPLTTLNALEEFKEFQDHPLDLIHLTTKLQDATLRFYIGNRDTRVNTSDCFEFIHALTEASYRAGHRTPPVELILSPSIGHRGHGTGPTTFRQGIDWLKKKVLIENN